MLKAIRSPGIDSPKLNLWNASGLYVLLLSLLIWGLNTVCLMRDSRPPVWDMAMHQSYALNYLPARHAEGLSVPFWSWSGIYPPFVHLVIAFFYYVFHPGPRIAILANIPATIILLWAIYELAKDLAGRGTARWACLLISLTPYLTWMSRETILDYWLSAWVAAGLLFMRRTRGFEDRCFSLILGLILALGLLTKWLFAAFMAPPLLYLLIQHQVWKNFNRLLNCTYALLIAGLLAGIWYVPNLDALIQYFPQNAQIGALEGEPPVFSIQSLVYYVRILEGYQLFALSFLLSAIAWGIATKRNLIRDGRFLGITILGACFILTLLRTKDPRFTMPLLGLVLIMPAAWIQSWPHTRLLNGARILLTTVLCFQTYMANFGISWLPEQVILARGYQGSLRWDWNLYLQNYFQILGPPRIEDWRQEQILSRIVEDSSQTGLRLSLGMIPDLPWFSAANFHLYSRLLATSVKVHRLVWTSEGIYPLGLVDYVIAVDGDQGMPWTTTTNQTLNYVVEHSELFRLIDRYPLPTGSVASLYRVRRGPER